MNSIKIFFKSLFTIILVFILLIMLMVISSKYVFKDRIPNVFGYSIFKVVSGSMEPNIKIGDFVIIKKTNNYKVNDIVTYIDNNNNLVTHRLIKINDFKVITKGDNNNTSDPEIALSSIQGKVIYKFQNFYASRGKILIILFGIFIFGSLITIILPSRKK